MSSKITISIEFKWWVRYYLASLILFTKFCRLLNEEAEPDWDKVGKILSKGMRVK